ncbi:MAG TPA: hypothetical protein DDW52_24530 [Planctomycetaceae bacterium]|nr:hypothetical protein [Planctomycetaceae bacterium]
MLQEAHPVAVIPDARRPTTKLIGHSAMVATSESDLFDHPGPKTRDYVALISGQERFCTKYAAYQGLFPI